MQMTHAPEMYRSSTPKRDRKESTLQIWSAYYWSNEGLIFTETFSVINDIDLAKLHK